MKQVLWSLLFLAVVAVTPSVANAQLAADFYREGGWQTVADSARLAVGGPGGNDYNGFAQMFTLTEETNMSGLDVQAKLFGWRPGETQLTYSFYGAGLVPQGPVLAQSDPVGFNFETQGDEESLFVPVSYDFKPGDYWLAENGEGGTAVETAQQIVDPPAVAPEPPSLWLLGVGLAGFVLAKRKLMFA